MAFQLSKYLEVLLKIRITNLKNNQKIDRTIKKLGDTR